MRKFSKKRTSGKNNEMVAAELARRGFVEQSDAFCRALAPLKPLTEGLGVVILLADEPDGEGSFIVAADTNLAVHGQVEALLEGAEMIAEKLESGHRLAVATMLQTLADEIDFNEDGHLDAPMSFRGKGH